MLNSSQGAALAAVIVSGATVMLLALRLQKSIKFSSIVSKPILLRPCIYKDGRRREKNMKKKKRVHFAEDLVEPTGNGEEYRRNRTFKNESTTNEDHEYRGMPANRMALYNGILRDRLVHHRLGYYSF